MKFSKYWCDAACSKAMAVASWSGVATAKGMNW